MLDASLNELIGQIYDAVIDPARWFDALEAIRNRHGWHAAAVTIVALPSGFETRVGVNIPPGVMEHPTITQDMTAMFGGQARLWQFPLEEPVLQSQQTDPASWGQYRFVREAALARAASAAGRRDQPHPR